VEEEERSREGSGNRKACLAVRAVGAEEEGGAGEEMRVGGVQQVFLPLETDRLQR
jgi:hypothetical protein